MGNILGRKIGMKTRMLQTSANEPNYSVLSSTRRTVLGKNPFWCRKKVKPIKQKNSILLKRGNRCLLILTVRYKVQKVDNVTSKIFYCGWGMANHICKEEKKSSNCTVCS